MIVFSLLIIFFIYKFLNVEKKEHNNNAIFTINNDIVELKSILPLSDDSGRSLKKSVSENVLPEVDFSVEGIGNIDQFVKYEVYLIPQSVSEELRYDYVKVYLTDSSDKPFEFYSNHAVPVFRELPVSNYNIDKKVLYSGTIACGKKQDFKLRLWLADVYFPLENETSFKGKIEFRVVG